jgi:LysM repeat protein
MPTPESLAVILPSPTLRSTFAPQMLTPVPTNTPLPTPTPVIHIVAPGDTLLGIALQYGVTLDDLQQVNGVLRPELLQIGQQIIIPVASSRSSSGGSAQFLLPTPSPATIVVTGTARYLTPVGSLWVLGEVFNPGDQPLENVQVRVGLMNNAGVEIGSDFTFTVLDFVPAGGRSPFGILFADPTAEIAGFQAFVVRAEPSYNNQVRYARLQVTNPAITQTDGTYHVTGSIVNAGTTQANGATVVVTVYDDQHRVTGYRQMSIPDKQLVAGATTTFDMTVAPDPSAPRVSDFTVTAEAKAQ